MLREHLRSLDFRNFEKYKDRINQENRTGVELLLLFASIILALNVAGEISQGRNILHMYPLMGQAAFIAAALLLFLFVLRKRKTDYTICIYVIEIPLMAVTMLAGTIGKPNEPTFTFLFFLLLLPILILDRPWHVVILIAALSVCYGILDYWVKDPSVFSRDSIHLINVCLMSISASLFILSIRIRNIEYAGFFADKADKDPLTGLYNRYGGRRHTDPSKPGIFVFIDLDRFKQINDRFGHLEGDRVLTDTADAIRSVFRKSDIMIRMGGDEFAVFAPGKWEERNIRSRLSALAEKIRGISAADEKGSSINVSASIGCVYDRDGCGSLDQLVQSADNEMYRVKQNGKDDFSITAI